MTTTYEPNHQSPFGYAYSGWLGAGDVTLDGYSEEELDEFHQIANQILDTPAYAEDINMECFAAALGRQL